MKKLCGVLVIGLLTLSQANAANFTCVNELGSKLSIKTFLINQNTRNATEGASIVLEDGGITKSLSGKLAIYPFSTYDLYNDQGDVAQLKISTITTHGGRCGRCLATIETQTYAKLTINQEEMDFVCSPAN